MFNRFWVWLLTHIYKLLIVRVQTLDKDKIRGYERLKTLGVVEVKSVQGPFTFIFKEDRRSQIREKQGLVFRITSYFVELECPEGLVETDNIFHRKAILVVKLKVKRTNYDALGKTLLETYISQFQAKSA